VLRTSRFVLVLIRTISHGFVDGRVRLPSSRKLLVSAVIGTPGFSLSSVWSFPPGIKFLSSRLSFIGELFVTTELCSCGCVAINLEHVSIRFINFHI
jgi:hypothetical protein